MHAETRSVLILVIVHQMLFVRPEVIVDIANVHLVILEIHTLVDVEKVRVIRTNDWNLYELFSKIFRKFIE